MERTTEIWTGLRSLLRLYDHMLKDVCKEHGLTLVEAEVVSFLRNNPKKDTAADIVELRMISKGAVSKAVEELIRKSLLERIPDTEDRRRIHLSLTDHALPIIEKIEEAKTNFMQELFAGLTSEEAALYHTLHTHIITNAKHCLERKNDNE